VHLHNWNFRNGRYEDDCFMLFPLTRLSRQAPSPMVRTHELSLSRILGREGGAVKQRRRVGNDHCLRYTRPMEETMCKRS